MKKIVILSLLTVTFILIRNNSFCQTKNVSRFGILTFERTQSIAQHSKQKYYWIVPLDSVNGDKIAMYPLFLEDYSRSDLENCKKGKRINMFTFTTGSEFDFGETYQNELLKLREVFEDHRKKIRTIKRKTRDNNTEVTKIYLTQLVGSFCNCNIYPESANKIIITDWSICQTRHLPWIK